MYTQLTDGKSFQCTRTTVTVLDPADPGALRRSNPAYVVVGAWDASEALGLPVGTAVFPIAGG
jgi:hypothetical protein